VRRDAQRLGYIDDEADMDPTLEDQSSAAPGQSQEEYEEDLFYEASAIVGGVSNAKPTVEHLRVLIARLPHRASPAAENPF
jgi:hypothetical protein